MEDNSNTLQRRKARENKERWNGKEKKRKREGQAFLDTYTYYNFCGITFHLKF